MGDVKQQNRSAIIEYLSRTGPVSRKDLAEAIGLTASSVTQIVGAFMEEGILHEVGTVDEAKGAGRKKVLIDIDYDAVYLYSVNIEVENTTVALTNLKGDVVSMKTFATDKALSPKEFLCGVAESCRKLSADKAGDTLKKRLKAVSVGVPGIVDTEGGISKQAYGIWEEEVPVCEILGSELALPCYIENNVNAFALATRIFGEGKDFDNLHIIKWGPGVGSAIVIDNNIYEGRKGKAAELGHVIVDPSGRRCSCGRKGCLETKVSYSALNEIAPFEQNEFAGVYSASDDKVKACFDDAMKLFARTIANAISLLAPNRIVLTGFLFKDELIREKVVAACREYDSKINERLIIYSSLSEKESFIGPVAAYWAVLGYL